MPLYSASAFLPPTCYLYFNDVENRKKEEKKKKKPPHLKPVHAFFTRLRSCGVKASFPRTREHVSVYIRTDLEKLRFGGQKDGSSSCTTLTKCDDYVVVVRLTKQAHRESETTQPKPPTQPAKPQICERAPKSKACFRLRSWQTLRTSATPGHELADPAY